MLVLPLPSVSHGLLSGEPQSVVERRDASSFRGVCFSSFFITHPLNLVAERRSRCPAQYPRSMHRDPILRTVRFLHLQILYGYDQKCPTYSTTCHDHRIAYLYWTGRDWTGCLQPARPSSSPPTSISANRDLLQRELAANQRQANTFAPGSYTTTTTQPPRVRTLLVPNAGNVSVPDLPKIDPTRNSSSRLGRIGSFTSRRSARSVLDSPLRVHVRVSTVYDRPVSVGSSDFGSPLDGSEEGGGMSRLERERDESVESSSGRTDTRSPPPAYPGSADGHA